MPSAEHGNPARPSSALAASEQGELKTPGRAQRPATHRLRPHMAGSQAARVRTYAVHHEASSTRTMVRLGVKVAFSDIFAGSPGARPPQNREKGRRRGRGGVTPGRGTWRGWCALEKTLGETRRP